ncbi:MAG TPA: DUF4232 domain-containing protein [Streptosporangiaceae bacterium]|nr:DUF4232 domain-containing protein [Streptosporangiaceae bacterium]
MIPTRRAARTALTIAALSCVGAGATACGTAGGPSAPSANPPTNPAATPSTPAATNPPAGGATSPAAAGPGSCATRDLQLSPGVAQGAAGSSYQVIVFKNIGNSSCTLYGYPGVAQAKGNPPTSPVKQVGAAADEDPTTPRQLVTLAPGQVANAVLRIVDAGNYSPSQCHPVAANYLQIYPPNQTTPVYLAYKSTACARTRTHILSVTVVKPGAGSS